MEGRSAPESRVDVLGSRLRAARMRAGLTLREMARRLGVSPSFVSQLENGRSQPSVATLYSMAQLLHVSIDELFVRERPHSVDVPEGADVISRSDLGSPADAWRDAPGQQRHSHVLPEQRRRLVMDSGVIWEQLAPTQDHALDFMEIIYPPGSSSTNDGRMLRHVGMEYGYLLSGQLEVTLGFETFTLGAGESLSFDPSVPHLFTNRGTIPARGIWAVHHGLATGQSGPAAEAAEADAAGEAAEGTADGPGSVQGAGPAEGAAGRGASGEDGNA